MSTHPKDSLRLEHFLPYVLSRLANKVSAELSTIYSGKYGLSVPEWRVIALLAEHSKLTAGNIITYSGMEKSKVSRAVAALAERKLVKRAACGEDNRRVNLELSAQGRKIYVALVPQMRAWEADLVSELDPADHALLLELLLKLQARTDGTALKGSEPFNQA